MYEITYITKNENAGSVKDELKELKAKILSEESLGRKRLAYKIKKENSGFYQSIVFEMGPQNLDILNKKLLLDTEIIRFLVVKKDKIIAKEEQPAIIKEKTIKAEKKEVILPTAKEIVKEEKPAVAKEKPAVTEVKKEKTKITKKVAKPKATPVKAKPEPKLPAKKEVSDEDRLKQLDDKLSELLKD